MRAPEQPSHRSEAGLRDVERMNRTKLPQSTKLKTRTQRKSVRVCVCAYEINYTYSSSRARIALCIKRKSRHLYESKWEKRTKNCAGSSDCCLWKCEIEWNGARRNGVNFTWTLKCADKIKICDKISWKFDGGSWLIIIASVASMERRKTAYTPPLSTPDDFQRTQTHAGCGRSTVCVCARLCVISNINWVLNGLKCFEFSRPYSGPYDV